MARGVCTHGALSSLPQVVLYLLYIVGPCYYVGSSQGGETPEREENDGIIEGTYLDYEVNGLFEHNYVYSQFQQEICDVELEAV